MFNQIGRKIYYDKNTGNVIMDTGEHSGYVTPTTVEDDINSYSILKERTKENLGVIHLEYGEYSEDFSISKGVRVNLETLSLEFLYFEENEEPATPTYKEPLTQQVATLKEQANIQEKAIAEISEMLVLSMMA